MQLPLSLVSTVSAMRDLPMPGSPGEQHDPTLTGLA
jgi:hypothetical protein